MAVDKDPRAVALCDHVRSLYAISPISGWIACPHHGKRLIQVGHRSYGSDPAITEQVDAVVHAIDRLKLAEAIGYQVVAVSR